MTRNELLSSPEYWDETMKQALWLQLELYKKRTGKTQYDVAQAAGISMYKLRTLWRDGATLDTYTACQVMLAIGVVPTIQFAALAEHLTPVPDESIPHGSGL